ncbi:MAG: hypothetical protein RQ801_10880 [Spirochaetaceae bacterium]|nr:hypothetical protein [Spirochaetaceae bacterium]MDT8298796.1 hypothetical protein [Spirochaetaceae bacterium]
MMKSFLWISYLLTSGVLAVVITAPIGASGPLVMDGEPVVSIYRDFDDGLFGRSRYRGIVFSVRRESFARYRTLPVRDFDGLTAYLLSAERAADLAAGRGYSTVVASPADDELASLYVFDNAGTRVVFSLERAPDDLYEEIDRTYPSNPEVAQEVSRSYRSGYVIRIHEAENVYRPETGRIDYEDVLISASLLGDEFQPLWGIHDGNDAAGG